MRIWLIAGIITLLLVVILCISNLSLGLIIGGGVFLLLGYGLFLSPWCLKLGKTSVMLGAVVCITLSLVLILVSLGFHLRTLLPPPPTNEVSQYSEIRAQWPQQWMTQVAHFPSSIPEQATETSLFYLPGFLQGGTILQLRLKLPTDQIERLQQDFRSRQVHAPSAASLILLHSGNSLKHSIPFPKEYEIICLGPNNIETLRENAQLNHGEIYGVAINKQTSEIIYWAEAW